jgi:trimeric autotransporter adhesin
MPSSVVIPAGSASRQFTILATGATAQNPFIAATLNGLSVVTSVSVIPAATSKLLIDSGGTTSSDSQGRVWSEDTGFIGGSAFTLTEVIGETDTPALYQSGRSGSNFSYALPLPNGLYTVVLKFAEPLFSEPGRRMLNVSINGDPALTDFDIFAEAGGKDLAVDRSFPASVSQGRLLIEFTSGRAGSPLVNAIEILNGVATASTSNPHAVRVNVGGDQFTDVSGVVWAPDSGFTGGAAETVTAAIPNSAPELYQTARIGAFRYNVAVPDGKYTVILKFAEIVHAAPDRRKFNVSINGDRVLSDFDVFAAAGGALVTIDRSFSVTVTNGSIDLDFRAGPIDLPLLNGIEIIPQN